MKRMTTLSGIGMILLVAGCDMAKSVTMDNSSSNPNPPSGPVAVQDSMTGNVTIRWNSPSSNAWIEVSGSSVDEGFRWGGVGESVVDSMGRLYLQEPMTGPWDTGLELYTLQAARTATGCPCSERTTTLLRLSPPHWTRAIRPVVLRTSTDTDLGVVHLAWDTFPHPDLLRFRVSRLVDSGSTCRDSSQYLSWDDGKCKDPRRLVVDQSGGDTLIRFHDANSRYVLAGVHRDGIGDSLASTTTRMIAPTLIDWRDSGSLPGLASLGTLGAWIAIQDTSGRTSISRDGFSWEDLPDAGSARAMKVGWGDSIWIASQQDSTHVRLRARGVISSWSDRLVKLPGRASLNSVAINGGRPVLNVTGPYSFSVQHSLVVDDTGIRIRPINDSVAKLMEGWIYSVPALPADPNQSPRVIGLSKGQVIDLGASDQGRIGVYDPAPTGMAQVIASHEGAAFISGAGANSVPRPFLHWVLIPASGGPMILLPSPTATVLSNLQGIVHGGEIWTYWNGELWKGRPRLR